MTDENDLNTSQKDSLLYRRNHNETDRKGKDMGELSAISPDGQPTKERITTNL